MPVCKDCGIELEFDATLDEECDGTVIMLKELGHCPHCHKAYKWLDYFEFDRYDELEEY